MASGLEHPGDPNPNRGAHLTQFTDPEGHPSVLAYRMGKVEEGVNGLKHQLELIAQNYPTQQTIQLLLNPLITRVDNLENEKKQEEASRTSLNGQLKLAITMAVVSPVLTFVIMLMLQQGRGN